MAFQTKKILLRKIATHETKLVQEIGVRTFVESFAKDNSAANMTAYLDDAFNLEALQIELDHPGSQFYAAEYEDRIIGYLKVNTGQAQTEKKLKNALEIERIYVLSEFQGRGVGQLLYRQALQIAKQEQCQWIWLGVWEHNTSAIGFYKKNGFQTFGTHQFTLGTEQQLDLLMKSPLT